MLESEALVALATSKAVWATFSSFGLTGISNCQAESHISDRELICLPGQGAVKCVLGICVDRHEYQLGSNAWPLGCEAKASRIHLQQHTVVPQGGGWTIHMLALKVMIFTVQGKLEVNDVCRRRLPVVHMRALHIKAGTSGQSGPHEASF